MMTADFHKVRANLVPFTANHSSFIIASICFMFWQLYCLEFNSPVSSVESATCPVVDSDRSWEVSIRNFKADISFKEHSTGQAVVDHFLIIQNYFPVHLKNRFLLSTCHQPLLTHVINFTMQEKPVMALEPLMSLKLGLSTLVT